MVRSKNKIPVETDYKFGKRFYDFFRWCKRCQLWKDKKACVRGFCPDCGFRVRTKPANKEWREKRKEVKDRAVP